MFPSNELFGEWVRNNLLQTTDRMDRAAAMWAAEYPEQYHKPPRVTNSSTIGRRLPWASCPKQKKSSSNGSPSVNLTQRGSTQRRK